MNRQIEKLRGDHAVEAFDCGHQELNRFLQKHALASQYSDGAQTYVGVVGQTVVGYYSLAVGSVEYREAPERMKKGLGQYSVPIMILARLAVDTRCQKQGFGAALLKDAMLRTIQAADIGGIRSLVVHAKDDVAKRFYEHFDFIPSLSDPLHLYILLKDLRHIVS